MTPPCPAVRRPAAAFGVLWLAALACTRPTPGYCGGDATKCRPDEFCSMRTSLCEKRDGGAGDASDARDGGDGGDVAEARDGGSDAGDASADVYKGCRTDPDCESSDAGPACVVDGGQCVTCTKPEHCKLSGAPACTSDHRCVECVVGTDCSPDAGSACTADNRCVECVVKEDCNAPLKVCQANRCYECVGSTDCQAPTPVCHTNRCVECVQDSDCKDPTKPICAANQCRGCMADSECKGEPGVCMKHQDGRCATPAQTIVVQNITGCAATATGPNDAIGTAAMPACSMQPLGQLVTMNRRVIVVRGTVQASNAALPTIGGGLVSIVGQQSAVIAGGASPCLQLSGADVYVRSVAFKSSTLAGIRATGGTLRADSIVVDNNAGGGIFLDATRFNIVGSTITNNGPGQEGTATWGGILVNALVPGGDKLLQRVTVQSNKATGISCIAGVDGTGVHASGNNALDIQTACGFTSCGAVGATCGAP